LHPIDCKLKDLSEQLINVDINFSYEFNKSIHDRYITTDTGWRILPGRGLDIFQPWERGFLSLENYSPEARLTRAFEVNYLREDQ